MKEIRTFSVQQTIDAGIRLGRLLKKGDVVCLSGDLGTGKTAFTSGIASALGIEGYITSPTFTIVNEYRKKVPLYHFDTYRLADPEEMLEIGFEEYIDGKGVVVIEWAERIKSILPEECIWVEIRKELQNGPDARIIRIRFEGGRHEAYEAKWSELYEERR